ncbi:hypothetical protein HOF56_00285 [Candidatus Peribacteria bacterium]|jgi:hypothetical protein|nr:hypothetical protein [Candidatus Peribacteria bacterium]MBT4021573.1 hypothetical protein [Candidatus Peribacteria bacterium]MBT4240733.1 hypothetical protein [Candidatus Peribacteria bacterium]MBT4474287.1 hypothetical protein [Candidatus Peribacteria bacterium]
MTTITIDDDLGFEKQSFASVSDMIAFLEEQNIFVMIREIDDVDSEIENKATEAINQFDKDPSSFSNL